MKIAFTLCMALLLGACASTPDMPQATGDWTPVNVAPVQPAKE